MKGTMIAVLVITAFSFKTAAETFELRSWQNIQRNASYNDPRQPDKDASLLKQLQSDPEYKNLSKQEQEVLYWINFARLDPKRYWKEFAEPALKQQFPRGNSYTKSLAADLNNLEGLKAYSISPKLQETSLYHAKDMAKSKKFQHESANGESFVKRMQRFGVKSPFAENLHAGTSTPFSAVLDLLLDYKVSNVGHRKSLLSNEYKTIGISYQPYRDRAIILVQDFSVE